MALFKFGYFEKATKFDVTEYRQILSGRIFQILWPSQNIRTLPPEIFHGSFHPDFFHGGSLKKVGCHTYKSDKKQVPTLEKYG